MNTLILGAGLRLLRFCFLKRIIARAVSLREQLGSVKIYAQNIEEGGIIDDVEVKRLFSSVCQENKKATISINGGK